MKFFVFAIVLASAAEISWAATTAAASVEILGCNFEPQCTDASARKVDFSSSNLDEDRFVLALCDGSFNLADSSNGCVRVNLVPRNDDVTGRVLLINDLELYLGIIEGSSAAAMTVSYMMMLLCAVFLL
eukprot:TRINITY_DN4933_c0_g1_i1.p1 TRINITY_DN4933_c0_g1~~TRINITY_DN4933_c0_g1_i1.p1  ORF type:complete len:129 (+),score=21.12 TRINITY_DN4933_c0_g1_i1:31-417(+)